MSKGGQDPRDTGRNPSAAEVAHAERVLAMPLAEQARHPGAVAADPSQMTHINTYGALPEFYIDRPFTCVTCGRTEIWRAADQKWYVETAKGHIDARAVRCSDCRRARRGNRGLPGI